MREIKLTQNKVALVDDEDFGRLNQFKWFAHYDRHNWYACRHTGRINGKDPTTGMHRTIMTPPDGMEVDHKDGNGLNNQKSNLRICQHIHNNRNLKPRSEKISSQLKGVSWNKRRKKFRARITSDRHTIYLGCFVSEQEAALAYDHAAKKLHGDYARTNY
jgi:hypothetical protein